MIQKKRDVIPGGAGLEPVSDKGEIEAFLSRATAVAPSPTGESGRLIFALDATMSRQPLWDRAMSLQADMFSEAARVGRLSIQLVYYRGIHECRASRWTGDARSLKDLMSRIECRGGRTQIRRVLQHAAREAAKDKVRALVFIGDAFEEEIDSVCAAAGELALRGVPALMFQEGGDAGASRAFAEIARLTRGVHCRFDTASAAQLGELLRAAAAYAAGGRAALENMSQAGSGARALLAHLH